MIGGVMHQELLLGGRRNRIHVFRWLYAGWLVLTVVWLFAEFLADEYNVAQARIGSRGENVVAHASAPEVVGARFAAHFVWQQTVLLLLAVPIFTAGAVVDEKRQGTLQYLLLSDLEPRHIILGKLVGRVAQVAFWLLAGFPLFGLLAGFGGVEPVTMGIVLAATGFMVVGLASISLLASVWCRQTRDAVLAVYTLVVLTWIIARTVGGPVSALNPLWVIEPAWGAVGSLDLPQAMRRLSLSAALWTGITVVSLGVASARLIPSYRAEIENLARRSEAWFSLEREPIGNDPVQWREQHVEGLAVNSTFRRIPLWQAIVAVALVSVVTSLLILQRGMAPGTTTVDVLQALLHLNVRRVTQLMPEASTGFLVQGIVVMLLASLVVGVRCAGALTQERERQTWEAVLLTPMSAKQIVRGKLWGICLASGWYLLAHAAPALTLSVLGGPLALAYTLVWLAATLLAIYFIGAAGLWCSARASSSWRSLLQTMGFGYLGGLSVFVLCSPAIFIVLGVLLFLVGMLDLLLGTRFAWLCVSNFSYTTRVFFLASAASLVALFWLLARFFLYRAQRWIADRERTRFQVDEPLYRRSRRRASLPDGV
ncbi:MAG: ABC transporter permease subunit [Gemmataceae bacterium]